MYSFFSFLNGVNISDVQKVLLLAVTLEHDLDIFLKKQFGMRVFHEKTYEPFGHSVPFGLTEKHLFFTEEFTKVQIWNSKKQQPIVNHWVKCLNY